MLPVGLSGMGEQCHMDMAGQAYTAEPGAFHGAVMQPVTAHPQTGSRVPPGAHVQPVGRVAIAPAVGRHLHAGWIGAAQFRKGL